MISFQNTYSPKVNVHGTKTWQDGGKPHTTLSNTDTVKLTLKRRAKGSTSWSTMSTSNYTVQWKGQEYTIPNLPKYGGSSEYEYMVTETREGYTSIALPAP